MINEMMGMRFPSSALWKRHDNNTLPIELEALINTPQDEIHHPEGNVFTHTCLVMDEANRIAFLENLNEADREVLILAAMCHDLGKPKTTVIQDNGKITAYGHPKAGIDPTITLLTTLGKNVEYIAHIIPLVEEHMAHVGFFTPEITHKTVQRLIKRLEPSNIHMLGYLIEADASGRGGQYFRSGLPDRMRQILEIAKSIESEHYPEPLVSGNDIIRVLNIPPSKLVGYIKNALYVAQLADEFSTTNTGILYLLIHKQKMIQDCLFTNEKTAV